MVNNNILEMDKVFSALSDPTRRTILDRLRQGQASISEIAEPFEISLPAISKHLKVLEKAGLISNVKEGRTHYLHLNPQPMKAAMEWLEFYRRLWEDQFDSLADYLAESDQTAEDSHD
ncbi:MAG TPA: metalloregulator ArsR/SmtB family transcription factor [Chloroflexia bacterium]|nr:metalloregulator ArsR/SmtB family transcription factor [Chloroflexia bacterium]